MKLLLLLPSPLKDPEIRTLINTYATRLRGRFTLEIVSVRGEKSDDAAARKREAERLLQRVPEGYLRVALDLKGEQRSSEAFARWLDARIRSGIRGIAFLIGGANGLDRGLVHGADVVLSLTKMTLPHQMAALVLCEQLYRADAILRGAPYHR